MSESGSSNTWSDSASSYFSDSSSSSSCPCPAPRQLVSLIGEQLRRMKCRKNDEGEVESVDMLMVDLDQKDYPQHLSVLLKERLERLNAESDEDDQPFNRSPIKVSFLDVPSRSDVESAPNLEAEQKLDTDVASSSTDSFNIGAFQQASSTSADAVMGGLEAHDMTKLFLDNEKSMIFLNFPDLHKLVDSITTKAELHVNGGSAKDLGAAEDSVEDNTKNAERPIRNNANGEVRLYDDGRVTISFGGEVYEMSRSARPAVDQEVVRVDQAMASGSGAMSSLGMVHDYIDVLPQMEDEDDNDEMRTDMIKTQK